MEDPLKNFLIRSKDLLVRGYEDRECLVTLYGFAGSNSYFLVHYTIFDVTISCNNRILHEDAVLDAGSFADMYASEEYAVIDFSLDKTSVCDKGVGNLGSRTISCGVVVSYCRVNIESIEECVKVLGIKKLHVLIKVAYHIGNSRRISLELVSADLIGSEHGSEYVSLVEYMSLCISSFDLCDELFSFNQVQIH